jgi:hypothetical protein
MMLRLLESLVGVFLLLGVLPWIVVVLAAQAFSRTKPVFVVREVWRKGSSIQRLEFTCPPGDFGLFLRRKRVLELASLLWLVTGKVRFAQLVWWSRRI